jgi:hypothetical protein
MYGKYSDARAELMTGQKGLDSRRKEEVSDSTR